MSLLDVLKKIGAVVTWPIRKAEMLEKILATALKDEPQVKQVVVGVVEQFESIDADVVAAVASGGVNIAADMKGYADIVAFFKYMKETALPTIEQTYTQLKLDTEGGETAPASGGSASGGDPATPAPPVPAAPALPTAPVPVVMEPTLHLSAQQ